MTEPGFNEDAPNFWAMTDDAWLESDMSEVTWKRHSLHEMYEIGSDGRVRRLEMNYINTRGHRRHYRQVDLVPYINGSGYVTVSLNVVKRTVTVHILVCETFHGPKPTPKHEVRHLNGDQLDNRPENLAWGTHVDNMRDRVLHGNHPEKNKTHCPKNHEYTEENTYRYGTGRRCNTCHRDRERAARRWRDRRKKAA